MNRTQFLHTILPLGLSAFLTKNAFASTETSIQPAKLRTPKYLQPGDTIAIACPASPVEKSDIENCVTALSGWGFKIKIGNTVGRHWQRFSATDEERAAELQSFLDDENVSAILFGRGGYGVMRIIDKLNWEKFTSYPKWLVGYSDITAIHCHVNANYRIPTLHAPMASSFSSQANGVSDSIRKALTGTAIQYDFPGYSKNICGQATAELVGGNLTLICAMQASNSELNTDNKILLIEDVSEYKYTIDRMLMTLKRSGKLRNLAALVVGGITRLKTDAETDYPMSVEEMILDKVKEYNYPVCFHFPSGHQPLNLAVKLGVPYQLTVTNSVCNLKEISNTKLPSGISAGNANSLSSSLAAVQDSVSMFR